jgi:putative transcriptional regulator
MMNPKSYTGDVICRPSQFAALIGISHRTLQNWEQGHRRPEGTASALLRVAESHPQAVLEALHR